MLVQLSTQQGRLRVLLAQSGAPRVHEVSLRHRLSVQRLSFNARAVQHRDRFLLHHFLRSWHVLVHKRPFRLDLILLGNIAIVVLGILGDYDIGEGNRANLHGSLAGVWHLHLLEFLKVNLVHH